MGESELLSQSAARATESGGAARTDVESPHGAPAAGHHFTTSGPKPAAVGSFNEQPGRSPSDRAFEESAPHWHLAAKRYNDAHPDHVATFNAATHSACVVDGELDVAHVAQFQRHHGLHADGMIGPHTVTAAHQLARTVGHPSAEGSAMANQMFREVNGGPGEASPTTGSGAPVHHATGHPSPEGSAMANQMFREVNGGPGEASPTTASGAPVGKTTPTTTTNASPTTSVETPSPAVGHPSAEGSAMAMQLFREVNGGPDQASPTDASGAPIADEQRAKR